MSINRRGSLAVVTDFLTTQQAAERLRISTARIRRMILDGVIKDVSKFGRDHMIPVSEVARLEKTDRKPGRPAVKKTS